MSKSSGKYFLLISTLTVVFLYSVGLKGYCSFIGTESFIKYMRCGVSLHAVKDFSFDFEKSFVEENKDTYKTNTFYFLQFNLLENIIKLEKTKEHK